MVVIVAVEEAHPQERKPRSPYHVREVSEDPVDSLVQTILSQLIDFSPIALIPLLIQLIFGWSWAFPDGHPACDTDEILGGSINNGNLCDLQIAMNSWEIQINTLVAFIIGGFVLSTVSLWRLRRTSYAALCGATRNLLINVSSIVPVSNGTALGDTRATMLRWTILGFELSVLKARSIIDTPKARDYLETVRLLKEGEWESLIDGDRHTTVWWIIQMQAKELYSRNVISEIEFGAICNAITLIRDKANDLMSVIDRDEPLLYRFVCSFLVKSYIFIEVCREGLEWAVLAFDVGWVQLYSEPWMYFAIGEVILYTFSFWMLFDLCRSLYNPFGNRRGIVFSLLVFVYQDLPHRTIADGLRKLSIELCAAKLPPTFLGGDNGMDTTIYAANIADFNAGTRADEIFNEEKDRFNDNFRLSDLFFNRSRKKR